ncbi:MAG: transglutaminase-like domain-containing protein [Syntrophaceae bacterium]
MISGILRNTFFKSFYIRYKKIALLLPLLVPLLSSCASLYFQPLPAPTEPLRIKDLGELPYQELWQGFVFNGEKIGFMNLKIVPMQKENLYRILSEAHMRFRFLGIDKRIFMKSVDTVRPDLRLVSFHYEQKMDEKSLILDGTNTEGTLNISQKSGDVKKETKINYTGALYPASVINIYPLLVGMATGVNYRYPVYDPQTQSIEEVTQAVITFEESKELGLEPAYKVETQMHGHSVSSWINVKGETIFELGYGGVLITYKEDETSAKKFLVEASMNKKDLILDFSLIKTDKPISCPRKAVFLEISVEGLSGSLASLRGPNQAISEQIINGKIATVFSIRGALLPKKETVGESLNRKDMILYLAPTQHIESDNPEIRKVAFDVVTGVATPVKKIERLVQWVSAEVKDEIVDSFSALEVLRTRKGECKAHAMLYTAMARAAGIPTKLVGGIVYMEGMGFLYHSWAESYADGWIAVDPTFNQMGVDATHVKLVEGHDWTSLLSLGKVVGQIKANIIQYACSQ